MNDKDVTFFEDSRSPYNGSVVSYKIFANSMVPHRVQSINITQLLTYFDATDTIDLLKIDIEGSEYEILEQTPSSELLRFKQITVEFHDFLDKNLEMRNFIIEDRLNSLGFISFKKGTNCWYGSSFYDTLFYQP